MHYVPFWIYRHWCYFITMLLSVRHVPFWNNDIPPRVLINRDNVTRCGYCTRIAAKPNFEIGRIGRAPLFFCVILTVLWYYRVLLLDHTMSGWLRIKLSYFFGIFLIKFPCGLSGKYPFGNFVRFSSRNTERTRKAGRSHHRGTLSRWTTTRRPRGSGRDCSRHTSLGTVSLL